MNGPETVSVERLCREVAESLWAIYHDRPDASHLIWPAKRDDSARVSEQESKIVITQLLERNELHYSVETPTREVYRQKGLSEMSARIDVTVYGSRSRADRILNVELKAGNPGSESFRKDFEKLLREGITGLWFHTLPKANASTWMSLAHKVETSLSDVLEHYELAAPALHFAFCVLDPPQLRQFHFDLAGDWRTECSRRFAGADPDAWLPEWAPAVGRQPRDTTRGLGSVTQRKRLVYIPSIEPRSFIHLNVQGEAYRLRCYGITRPRSPWVESDCKTTSELLARHGIVHEVDVSTAGKNLDHEPDYWSARVAEVNQTYGIG